MGSGLLMCPKYLGILVVFSIIKNYQNNPVWMDWRWWMIVGFSLFTFGSLVYNRYYSGLSFGILTDILWIILYSAILYMYLPKFDQKSQVDKRVDDIPMRFGHFIMTATALIISLSVFVIVLCISQLIPFLDFVTIPVVRVLSFIL